MPGIAAAESTESGISTSIPPEMEKLMQQQWEEVTKQQFETYINELNRQIEPYFPPLDWKTILDSEKRSQYLNPLHWLKIAARLLIDDLVRNSSLLAQLVALAILGSLLRNLQSAFSQESVGRLADAVVHMVLLTIALASFYVALQTARSVVDDLVNFLLAALPVMLSLLIATGHLATGGVMSPMLFALAHSVNLVVANWVMPLLFFAALLQIVPSITNNFRFHSLALLVRQSALGILFAVVGIFVLLVGLQGAAGAMADGLGMRAMKYAARSFVPVIGGMIADAGELILSASMLLRNAIGLAGLVAVLFIVFFPTVKLVAMIIVYRVGAAIIQPLGAERVVTDLHAIAASLGFITVAVGAVAIMTFFVIALLIGIGNVGVMLR